MLPHSGDSGEKQPVDLGGLFLTLHYIQVTFGNHLRYGSQADMLFTGT